MPDETSRDRDGAEQTPPARRPSGAPEIPAILREPAAAPEPPKRRRFSLVPDNRSTEMRALGIGLDFAAYTAAAMLMGWGVTFIFPGPWLVVGAVIGIVVASWNLFKQARRLNAELSKAERERFGK